MKTFLVFWLEVSDEFFTFLVTHPVKLDHSIVDFDVRILANLAFEITSIRQYLFFDSIFSFRVKLATPNPPALTKSDLFVSDNSSELINKLI